MGGFSTALEFTTLIFFEVFCRAFASPTSGVIAVLYTFPFAVNTLSSLQISNTRRILSSSIKFNTGRVIAHFFTGMYVQSRLYSNHA